MENWSDEYITIQASNDAQKNRLLHYLLKCKDRPFVINNGACGYGDLAHHGDPEKMKIQSEMHSLAFEGYLDQKVEPTGSSRTFSSRDHTFTLTEKGRQLLVDEGYLEFGSGVMGMPDRECEIGETVSRDPSKGTQPLCLVCYHHHPPIHLGGYHLD